MRATDRTVAVAVIASACALSAPAQAQSASDKALAESLFQDAKKLFADGKIALACDKLAESQRLDPRMGTLLNLASCHEEQGKTASAWIEFTDLAAQAARAKQRDREKLARERAEQLRKRLSRLVIDAPDAPAGLEVRLDGNPIASASLGTPIPLDPGEHEIAASAPGKAAWTAHVAIEAGPSDKTMHVPALAAEAAPEPTVGAQPAPSPAPPAASAAPNADSQSSIATGRLALGLVVGGVGLAGLAVGTVFGLQTLSKKHDSDAHCTDSLCDSQGLALRDDAKTSARISDVAFGGGALLVIAGVVLVATARTSHGPSRAGRASAWVAPAVDPARVGVRAGGAW